MKNIFKNILKQNTIYYLPVIASAISLFSACSEQKEENINGKLSANLSLFENQLKNDGYFTNSFSKEFQYNEESLRNDKNSYDYEGHLILEKHKIIESFIEANVALPNKTFSDNIEPFIGDQITAFTIIKKENLNADEKILLDSFEKNFVPSVELISDYEDFVYDNYPDQSKVSKFLTIISRIKYTIFITDSDIYNKRTLSGYESCVNNCMAKAYRDYNAVNWTEFALNPGGGVLWQAASCAWDCRRSNYYGN